MSLQSKVIATAQGVGSSAAVQMNDTPFMERHAAVAILTQSAGGDRTVDLEKSDDQGTTWTSIKQLTAAGSERVPIASLSERYRVTVAGGTTGTGDCKFEA